MSFWIPRRDAQGRLYYYTINFPLLYIPVILGMFLAILGSLAATAPLEALAVSFGMLLVGFALFLRAKVSVYQHGFWFSFGSARMSARMRRLYRLGYCIMIPAALVTFLLSVLVIRMHD
jgi:hypothetical protein